MRQRRIGKKKKKKKFTILTNISTTFINILKFAQSLDNVNLLSRPGDNHFRPFMKAIVQDFERFENMTPVLALIVQSLVQHFHDFIKVRRPNQMVLSLAFVIFFYLLLFTGNDKIGIGNLPSKR